MKKNNILISPIFSEKTIKEAGQGRFTFRVGLKTTKPQIKEAVEENFNVKVKNTKTLIVKGRKKNVGKKRTSLKLGPWKKAIVTLLSGQKIEIFAGLENEQKP